MRQLPMKPHVVTFFYGSYINKDVLAEVDLIPAELVVARLPGYDLDIRPLANLVPSDRHTVYGVLAKATHEELGRLYRHAEAVLGGTYLPYPVLTTTLDDQTVPALCYISQGTVWRGRGFGLRATDTRSRPRVRISRLVSGEDRILRPLVDDA